MQLTAQQVLVVLCDHSSFGVLASDMFCLQGVGDDPGGLLFPFVVLSFRGAFWSDSTQSNMVSSVVEFRCDVSLTNWYFQG
jgi:hypothetical protein